MRHAQRCILDAITATIADGGWGWDTFEVAEMLRCPQYVAAGHLLQMKRRGVLEPVRRRTLPQRPVTMWRLP